jgi:hypothetical protein
MKKLYFSILLVSAALFAQPGNLCTNPIVISSLPYTTTDDTANYGDNYDPQTTTHPDCNGQTYGNYYHGGNDVIYAYTPAANGTVKFEIPNAVGWTGMFIYTDCANIGVLYAGCSKSSAAGPRTVDNFAVTAGQTYYIYISSWPTPQTVPYTLNVTDVVLGANQVTQNKSVTLYPNPVKEELFLDTNFGVEKVSIVNVNGQRIAAQFTDSNVINVNDLAAGFYILELTTQDGVTLHKNFIKSAR